MVLLANEAEQNKINEADVIPFFYLHINQLQNRTQLFHISMEPTKRCDSTHVRNVVSDSIFILCVLKFFLTISPFKPTKMHKV
ncbi:unnamed protein product [Camellia sinensis]